MTRLAVGANLAAFLDMIAFSEGTATCKATKDEGYDILVGGTRFASYDDHPRKLVDLPRLGIKSTAAGRYQLLARYWDAYRVSLDLEGGFTPENQDRVAIQQIRERGALDLIKQGRFDEAVSRVRNIWASLPGAGYGQHENKIGPLRTAYLEAGGSVA